MDQHKKLWKEDKFLNLWVIKKTYASRLPIAYKIHTPPYILAHFELKSVQEQQDNGTLEIELEEPNLIPDEFGEGKFYSKGFYPKITIQDFPLRGQRVFLHIKRRRWMKMDGEEKGSIITRDWNVVSKGTRMTKEFAAFLKECRRYPTI